MRTTLNIDDALMERIARRFPAGTPKTVIIEECLRRALSAPEPGDRAHPAEVAELAARGVLAPPSRTGVPPQSALPPLPPGVLLRDLAADREDR